MFDAMDIWEKINRAPGVARALQFYQTSGKNSIDVLARGSADFDEKVTDNPNEKAGFRALYYMSSEGYMQMHLRQNLEALRQCLGTAIAQFDTIEFFDFGCGPMTAGLALRQLLDDTYFQGKCVYRGIDVAKNMRRLARKINAEFKIFDDCKFRSPTEFQSQLSQMKNAAGKLSILCLSHVLAPDTYKKSGQITMQDLASRWRQYVDDNFIKETRIIYSNPKHDGFHDNWENFKNLFFQENNSKTYTTSGLKPVAWGGQNPCMVEQIIGSCKNV